MIELKNSKTTCLGKASGRERYSLDAFIGAVQMREPGGEWQDIRPALVRDADGWHVEGAPYYAEIKDDGTRLFCPDRNEKSKYLRLPSPVYFAALPRNPVSHPTKVDRALLPDQITLPADWGEFRIVFSNTGMHFEVLFAKGPPDTVFGKDSPRILLDAEASGYDIAQLLKATAGTGIPRPRLIRANQGLLESELPERWLDWGFKNGQLELGFDFGELPFPILLKNTTVDVQVEAGQDDGMVSGSNFNSTGNYITLGQGSSDASGFFRFTGVTIGGKIDAAYVQAYSNYQMGTPALKIYGVNEDNPAEPTTAAEFNDDPLTSASVDWDGTFDDEAWNTSPSLNTIFQELVDAYTIENDAVMIQIKDDQASSNQYNQIRTYETPPQGTLGVKLHIEYTEGGTTERSSSESGAGTDGSAIAANLDEEESGGGTDARLELLATLGENDGGAGIEQSLLSLLLTSVDAGISSETLDNLLAALVKSDNGSGIEGVAGRGLVLPDSGYGVDVLSSLITVILGGETGSGIEQSVLTSIVLKLASETGSGADAAELIAEIITGETGLGIDAGVIVGLKQLFSGDGGTSGDALKALIAISRSSPDMKLPGRAGQARIPSKGVSL
jgi:hypothetical protein